MLVRRLSRLDHLNVEMGLLGQTARGRPIVFLDRIDASAIRDLLDAAGLQQVAKSRRQLTAADQAALYELRRVLAARAGGRRSMPWSRRSPSATKPSRPCASACTAASFRSASPSPSSMRTPGLTRCGPATSLSRPGVHDPRYRPAQRRVRQCQAGQRRLAADHQDRARCPRPGTEAHELRHALDDEEETGRLAKRPARRRVPSLRGCWRSPATTNASRPRPSTSCAPTSVSCTTRPPRRA